MEDNLSVRLHGVKDLRVENAPLPDPGPNEVLIQPALVGICGTDLHFYKEAAIGMYVQERPVTLGHEISAVVCKLGADVTELQVGDKVAVDPVVACGSCFYCARQRVNLCTDFCIAGIPNTDGGFARYMVTAATSCNKLPEGLTLEEAALTEPLSVVVWGFHRCPVQSGETVLVIGAGTIGLLTAQVAKVKGAQRVLVVDVVQDRLEVASQLGVDATLRVDPKAGPEKNAELIKAAMGVDIDLCVECSGAPGTVDTAIFSCRRAGRVLMLGLGEMKMDVHLGLAALNEIDVIGSVCNNNVLPESVQLLSSGKVKVKPLISKKIPLNKFKDALDILESGSRGVIKILIECQK